MATVFLAFVVFTGLGETPPKIVGSFKTLDDCFAAAKSRNHELEAHPEFGGRGFVCLQMRGEN